MINIEILSHINATFGRQYPAEKWFQWATDVVSKGKKSQRNQLWAEPVRHWLINYDYLDKDERNLFIELFMRSAGRFRTYLIADDDDFACSESECSITASAGDTETQLIKSYYSATAETWDEDKVRIRPSGIYAPTIWLDSVEKTEDTHFTLDDDTGIIDWTGGGSPNGAMSGGEIITADYQFYFPVRFDFDVNKDIRKIPEHWYYHGIHLVEDSG